MGRMLARLTRDVTRRQVRHVAPVSRAPKGSLVDRVYRQVESDFGLLAPPVALHAPAPVMLAACWTMLRESTIAGGAAPRVDKEKVAASVSESNACPYCVDIHHSTVVGLSRRAGRDTLRPADRTGDPEVARAELAAVAFTFEYLNRMVNVFLVGSPLPGRTAAWARAGAARLLARYASVAVAPGAALDLLPAGVSEPEDLAWARGASRVHTAMARAVTAIDAAADLDLPEGVRRVVVEQLRNPAGQEQLTGFRDRLDGALRPLASRDRAAGRLALLTALASYRVSDSVVAEARTAGYDDRRLIVLCGWASLAAARRAIRP